MNLHDVRASFESRVASIEKETSYLLGKLALVSEAQKIAAEIGGASPVPTQVSGEPTGSFSQTVTALPAGEPVSGAAAETPAPAPVVESTPEPAEDTAEYSNVAQLLRPSATEEPAAEAAEREEPVSEVGEAPAAVAETVEPEPEAEAAAPSSEDVAEQTADAAEVAARVAEEADDEETSLDARVDQVLAEFEQEAMAQAAPEQAVAVEAPAAEAESAEVEAQDDSSENTAELEKLAEPETAEAQAEEEPEPEEKPDALASLREKLASAAAEEPPKSPFLTLGKFLNRAK